MSRIAWRFSVKPVIAWWLRRSYKLISRLHTWWIVGEDANIRLVVWMQPRAGLTPLLSAIFSLDCAPKAGAPWSGESPLRSTAVPFRLIAQIKIPKHEGFLWIGQRLHLYQAEMSLGWVEVRQVRGYLQLIALMKPNEFIKNICLDGL